MQLRLHAKTQARRSRQVDADDRSGMIWENAGQMESQIAEHRVLGEEVRRSSKMALL